MLQSRGRSPSRASPTRSFIGETRGCSKGQKARLNLADPAADDPQGDVRSNWSGPTRSDRTRSGRAVVESPRAAPAVGGHPVEESQRPVQPMVLVTVPRSPPPGPVKDDPAGPRRKIRYYRFVLPQEIDKPLLSSHPLTWSPISHVIWDGMQPELLGVGQQQAMLDWLHWGGQLIVVGGPGPVYAPAPRELPRSLTSLPRPRASRFPCQAAELTGPFGNAYLPPLAGGRSRRPDRLGNITLARKPRMVMGRRYKAAEPILTTGQEADLFRRPHPQARCKRRSRLGGRGTTLRIAVEWKVGPGPSRDAQLRDHRPRPRQMGRASTVWSDGSSCGVPRSESSNHSDQAPNGGRVSLPPRYESHYPAPT